MTADKIKWACGCETWNEDGKFYIKPCSPECRVFKTAMQESASRGNLIVYKEANHA